MDVPQPAALAGMDDFLVLQLRKAVDHAAPSRHNGIAELMRAAPAFMTG
jgi:hypothetical protein